MRAAATLLLAACYAPTVATSVPCASNRDCPQGQVCAANDLCELAGRDAATDAPPDAAIKWAPRQLLAELNTAGNETDPTITADGLCLVFSSDRPGGLGLTDLYQATRASRDVPFGPPIALTEVNTTTSDNAAELSGDGLTIYLRRSADVYTAKRTSRTAAFDTPVFDAQLSTAATETNPSISRDDLTFSVTRESGMDRELYVFDRSSPAQGWGVARQLTELSTPLVDSGAAFGANGLVIIWHTDRDSPTFDLDDLYIATRPNKNQPFRDPAPIAELNTEAGSESDPAITADLRYIVFECDNELCFSTR